MLKLLLGASVNSEIRMRIAVLGAGYVGLTTASCLAKIGHAVTSHDVDKNKIRALQRGELAIFEPGLDEAIREATAAGRLLFCEDVVSALSDVNVVMLTVGTPAKCDGDIDLSQVEAAARLLAPYLTPAAIVVIKSTVSVGTARRIRELIAEERGALDIAVGSNPELLREGSALRDFLKPDRIVIGADDRHTAAVLQEVYAPLAASQVPVMVMATPNAELVKHAANALLALKIGFINDVAELCERAGADILEVAAGVGADSRIGTSFLMPGPGYGGSCFPKDTRAFAAAGRRHNAPQPLIEALIERNEVRKSSVAGLIAGMANRAGAKVCILGAAFKKDTDDIRESPAMAIAVELERLGFEVHGHDPKAMANARLAAPSVQWAHDPYEAARGCEIVAIATEWDEYRELDLKRLCAAMAGTLLFDLRNILHPDAVLAAGLDYRGLGRTSRRSHTGPELKSGPPRRTAGHRTVAGAAM